MPALLEPNFKRRAFSELQKIQFVYQMADTALNLKQRVGGILGRPVEFYQRICGKKQCEKATEKQIGWLEDVTSMKEILSGIARAVEITEKGYRLCNRCPTAIDPICKTQTALTFEATPNHMTPCHRSLSEIASADRFLEPFQ